MSQSPQIGSMFLTGGHITAMRQLLAKVESQSPQIGSMFLTCPNQIPVEDESTESQSPQIGSMFLTY